MVNEVNKIIGNMLISGREVCIGGVGTLFTVRYAAYRTSRKRMTPPYRVVTFTEEQRGTSLEEEIARTAGIEGEQAHEIFERWLSESLDGDTLNIAGIGTLRRDKFTADEVFATTLNPQGRLPMRLKPKANVGLYIFAALCLGFALVVAGYLYIDNLEISLSEILNHRKEVVAEAQPTEQDSTIEPTCEVVTAVSEEQYAPVETSEATATESTTTKVAEVSTTPALPEADAPATEQADQAAQTAHNRAEEVLATTPGTSYVVLGVFSTTENTARAIREAQKRANDLQYSVYHYGEKFMVAIYDAPSRGECQEFVNSLGNTFKDLWIYTKR